MTCPSTPAKSSVTPSMWNCPNDHEDLVLDDDPAQTGQGSLSILNDPLRTVFIPCQLIIGAIHVITGVPVIVPSLKGVVSG